MSEHTPGPYSINVARLSDGSINVAHVLGPQGQGLAQVGVYDEGETLANLAMFAAAPDLKAALRDSWQLVAELEDAINKGLKLLPADIERIAQSCAASRAAMAKTESRP